MSYYCAAANTAAAAADLVAALQLASEDLGDELDALAHAADGEYTGGMFVSLDANQYPAAVFEAMQELAGENEGVVCATVATREALSDWKAANYDEPES